MPNEAESDGPAMITVIVRDEDAAGKPSKERGGGERGLTLLSDHMRGVRVPIPTSALEQGIEEFVNSMKGAIAKAATTVGEFRLEKVTLSAEVNGKGKLELLGTGGEAGGKAGITFEFKRQP